MTVFEGISLPKVIFETNSKFNDKISVIQVGKTKKLSVDGMVQSVNWDSVSAKRMYWGSLINILKANVPELQNIMIFGLGGGALQHLISREFPSASMISIEIDPAMVEVAKNHFDLESIPNHRVIIEDACKVVIEPEKYEIKPAFFESLIVDIYCGKEYPDLGDTGNFIVRSKSLIMPGGLMIFNRIYLNDHQDDVNHFINVISKYLSEIKTEVIAGKTNSDNILIYGRV